MVAIDAAAPVEEKACELKRPISSYWIWLGENRADVVKALDGNAKGSLVAKKAGEMWKALSAEEKAPFEAKAKTLKDEYLEKMPAKIAKVKEAKQELPGRKKPMTPVFAYINEKRTEIMKMDGIKGLGQVSKKGNEIYNALPEEEKKERTAKYEAEMKSYKEWGQTDEGKECLRNKKEASCEKRAVKKTKLANKGKSKSEIAAEKKEAKVAATKDAKESKASDAKDAKDAKADEKKKASDAGKMAKASAKKVAAKRKATDKAAKPAKVAKTAKGRKPSAPAAPTIDAEVLKKAEKLGKANGVDYKVLLQKLMASDGIKGKVTDDKGLATLEKCGGLVNKARNMLK